MVFCKLEVGDRLSSLVGLEELQLMCMGRDVHHGGFSWPGAQLHGLTRLRQLSVDTTGEASDYWYTVDSGGAVATFATAAGCSMLTQVQLAGQVRSDEAAQLANIGVLPQLRQLSLRLDCLGPGMPEVRTWLAQQTALTRLTMKEWDEQTAADALLVLPPSLQHLCLEGYNCVAVPQALQRLTGLEVLTIDSNSLVQLPAWLSQLQRLHRLDCGRLSVPQALQSKLPLLR
jgi:hypothetical protein